MDESKLEERRREIGMTGDGRVGRTRQALARALRTELDAPPPADLSVAGISRTAGVSRATFYSHFADIDALAVFSIDVLFADLIQQDAQLRRTPGLDRYDVARQSLRRLVDAVADRRGILVFARALVTRSSVQERLFGLIQTVVRSALGIEHPDMPKRVIDRATTFVSAAFTAVILETLSADHSVNRDELVQDMLLLIPSWIVAGHPESLGTAAT